MIKSVFNYISVLLLFLVFSSCQKELSFDSTGSGSPDKEILGDWKFISMDVTTEVTDEISDGQDTYKSISRTEYTTTNNKGSVKIEAGKMTSTGFSYDVSTTIKADTYFNNTFIETLEVPFNISMPPSSSSGEYQKIGSDSLYFPNGSIVNVDISGSMQSAPGGARYWFEGTQLIMASTIHQFAEDSSMGNTETTRYKATYAIRLERE